MKRAGGPRARWELRLALLAAAGLAAVAAVYALSPGETRRVDEARIQTAVVARGPFQEYVALTGTVNPLRTVFLDAVVGGQVIRRVVDEGEMVEAGDPLFILDNDETALEVLQSESQIEEQLATIRQGRLALDQNQLNLRQQLAELDYDITRLERSEVRTEGLTRRGAAAVQELEEIRDELAYAKRRRDLTLAAQRADQEQRATQLRDTEASVQRLRENLSIVRGTRENLVVRAPVDGQFSALEAEVGELKTRGARLGQIDVLNQVLVRVSVDEYYLARISVGQPATVVLDGVTYQMRIRTIYPEVEGGTFDAEMVFDGLSPTGLRRGQSIQMRLELGDPEDTLLLERGPFFADTGGKWVFVVNPDGGGATRVPVTLGRQNPQHFEVEAGLNDGDRIVISSYATFEAADELVFN